MISPWTPPGTKVIFKPISYAWTLATAEARALLREDGCYILAAIEPTSEGDYGAFLVETARFHRWRRDEIGKHRFIFRIEDFRLASLPRSITDCLSASRLPRPAREPVGERGTGQGDVGGRARVTPSLDLVGAAAELAGEPGAGPFEPGAGVSHEGGEVSGGHATDNTRRDSRILRRLRRD